MISGEDQSDYWRGLKIFIEALGFHSSLELAGSKHGEGRVLELLGWLRGGVRKGFDWSSKGVSQGEPSTIVGA